MAKSDLTRLKQNWESVQDRMDTGNDKESFVATICDMLPESKLLMQLHQTYKPGEILVTEGKPNPYLFVILEGFISQAKKAYDEDEHEPIAVDIQGPGDFIGLLSFKTGEPAFTTAKANSPVSTLTINKKQFEILLERYPEIGKVLQGLIFSNLAERYRRVVTLHLEVEHLSRQLTSERDKLREVIIELERTRDLLITQEKMATLGELTAGLAHEINNPASALLRSVDYLVRSLPNMAERASALPDTGMVRELFEAGMKREALNTGSHREKMKQLSDQFPRLSRVLIRGLAEMDDATLERITPFAKKEENEEKLKLLLECFQAGAFLGGIRLSTSRIEHLVKSLKSYSRQSGVDPENADIREGLRETVLIAGNRLKDIEVKMDLPDVPPVYCFVGELNQVWTNIIMNACDAMDEKGALFISCGTDADDMVWVRIGDSGPGVPDHLKSRIFESSFTTKTAGGEFGLGIGLAISKGIVERHRGTIEVRDRKGGGAEFLVRLPSAKYVKK